MIIQDWNPRGLPIANKYGVAHNDRPQWNAEHEIEIDLKIACLPWDTSITQSPFSSGVIFRHPPDGEALPRKNSLNSPLDIGTFNEHCLTVLGSHIVQIDVDREPRGVKNEKVQGCPTLERQFALEEWMTLESIK